jgi:hypothetical protein
LDRSIAYKMLSGEVVVGLRRVVSAESAAMRRRGLAGPLRCAPLVAMVETTDFGDRDVLLP